MTVSSTSNKTSNAAAAATTPAAAAATTTPATSGTSAASATPDSYTNPSSVLNQSDFLQLLVAQIQYQDPMNPQSDTDMAAQMAQFTTLQQATQSTNSLAMMQANSLIGSDVTVQVDSQTTAKGVVTGVVLNSGAPQITINGTNYGLSQVTAVVPPSATTTTSTTTPTSSSSGAGDTSGSNGTTGTTSSTTQNSN